MLKIIGVKLLVKDSIFVNKNSIVNEVDSNNKVSRARF